MFILENQKIQQQQREQEEEQEKGLKNCLIDSESILNQHIYKNKKIIKLMEMEITEKNWNENIFKKNGNENKNEKNIQYNFIKQQKNQNEIDKEENFHIDIYDKLQIISSIKNQDDFEKYDNEIQKWKVYKIYFFLKNIT